MKKEESIAEYDKRIWENTKIAFGFFLFISLQVWLCNLLDIGV